MSSAALTAASQFPMSGGTSTSTAPSRKDNPPYISTGTKLIVLGIILLAAIAVSVWRLQDMVDPTDKTIAFTPLVASPLGILMIIFGWCLRRDSPEAARARREGIVGGRSHPQRASVPARGVSVPAAARGGVRRPVAPFPRSIRLVPERGETGAQCRERLRVRGCPEFVSRDHLGREERRDYSMVPFSLMEGLYSGLRARMLFRFRNLGGYDFRNPKTNRKVGCLLALACGDAIGSASEFHAFRRKGYGKVEMGREGITGYDRRIRPRFPLDPGQTTDDTAMALCLGDSLLEGDFLADGRLDGVQLQLRFLDWWFHGYNNAFTGERPHPSIGLGGNISSTFDAFLGVGRTRNDKGPYISTAENEHASGNGSLMRLAPVALFARSEEEARSLAIQQSKVTHQGKEAAACCELMAYLLYHAFNLQVGIDQNDPKAVKDYVFAKLSVFRSSEGVTSVDGLARSEAAVLNPKTKQPEKWNWKDADFTFNPDRRMRREDGTLDSGYLGSYAMDGLAMALHCVWTTDSLENAVLKAATRGGDADSVGAIAGQLAGAIYGVTAIPKGWIEAVEQWDRGGEIAARAYALAERAEGRGPRETMASLA